MKREINEDILKRLKSAMSILHARKEEAKEPHFADPNPEPAGQTVPAPAPENTNYSDAEEREGTMLQASTAHTVFTSHLRASRDLGEMLHRHATELADWKARHGNAAGPLEKHVATLSRAQVRASSASHKVTKDAKESAALAGLTALRGAGFHALQGLKHNKAKPVKHAIKPKYELEDVPKDKVLTKK